MQPVVVAVGKHGTFTGAETENFDRELARYDGKSRMLSACRVGAGCRCR